MRAPVETFSATVSYYIDGVPVKKRIRLSHFPDSTGLFKLLTNPNYFSETMHWQERRKLLLEVCGDISDDEVISLNPELADLPKILGAAGMTIKIITARKRGHQQGPGRQPSEDRRGQPRVARSDVDP